MSIKKYVDRGSAVAVFLVMLCSCLSLFFLVLFSSTAVKTIERSSVETDMTGHGDIIY